jgi:hypothetical protein
MGAGSKFDASQGDQDGRTKGPQNNQQRQGQDPNPSVIERTLDVVVVCPNKKPRT